MQATRLPLQQRQFATSTFTYRFVRASARIAHFIKIYWIARKRGDFAKRYCAISISNARALH